MCTNLFAMETKNINYSSGKTHFGCETIRFIMGRRCSRTQIKEIALAWYPNDN